MNISAEVSTGGGQMVLEEGPDTMNSSDEESKEEEHGDEEKNTYVGGIKAPAMLSQIEVARQRAAAAVLKELSLPMSQPPASLSPERVESSGSDLPRSQSSSSFPDLSIARSEFEISGPRGSSKPRPTPQKGKGQKDSKAATRPAVSSESSHPMSTRSKGECVAGSTRVAAGSV
jgi:hypothetical protein